jgi:hypothetical protein
MQEFNGDTQTPAGREPGGGVEQRLEALVEKNSGSASSRPPRPSAASPRRVS